MLNRADKPLCLQIIYPPPPPPKLFKCFYGSRLVVQKLFALAALIPLLFFTACPTESDSDPEPAKPTVTSITVSPATPNLVKGGTQQFTATVSGTNNPAQTVTWTVTGGVSGTSIDSTGKLTVGADETATTLTVTATSTVDTSKSDTATVKVYGSEAELPTVTGVTVSPTAPTVAKGGTQQFTATVNGTNDPDQTVTWTVEGGGNGTSINNKGLLTVADNETATTLTVKAASTVDTSKSGTTSVTVGGESLSNVVGIAAYLSAATGGATAAEAVSLNVRLDLTNDWAALLTAIQTADKFVALDLSACTLSGTEYDPGTAKTGESKIVSLVLPNAATSIKRNSGFRNFTALTSVSGSAVETIGDSAFNGCAALTEVNFPAATSIGDSTFSGCKALTEVNLPAATDIGKNAFTNCTALTTVNLPAATSIGEQAFSKCAALTTVSLPAATSIGEQAFLNCTALTTVNLPAATSIGDSAFKECGALTELNLPKVTDLDDTVFGSAYHTAKNNIKILTLGLSSIGTEFKSGWGGLTKVSFPAATSVDSEAFGSARGHTTLTEVDLPVATSIGKQAFLNCAALTTVNLPAATSIGDSAFNGCAVLTTVSLPVATSIGDRAFSNCAVLTTVSLPVATSIGESAFSNCAALTTVNLPAATSIGERAFSKCAALTTVNLPAATSIGNFAFESCGTGDLSITLGSTAPTLGGSSFSSVSAAKTVTVKVPSNATGYGTLPTTYSGEDATVNWGNGFRGKGWTGSAFQSSGSINKNITLTIQAQ